MRIIIAHLHETEVRLVGDVVLEHVEDELLLDGLPHRVKVKRCLPRWAGFIKNLQRFVFRRRSECEEAQVRLLTALHHLPHYAGQMIRVVVRVQALVDNVLHSCFLHSVRVEHAF